ncbi:hypothetical protein [Leifsonia sp. NPDC080035]|uniref:Secreted protein n=1 Tax=Leifsonia sp. NPDC080035 TaxID=3143936 RepID=A0AAU7GBB8_9MICO
MQSNIIPAVAAAFCAMASLAVSAGSVDTARPARPAAAPAAADSESRTLGCGAGVVEVAWSSESPVGLVVREGNTVEAFGFDVRPAESGSHAYTSGRHTLTWSFVDDDGRPAEPEYHAICVAYF